MIEVSASGTDKCFRIVVKGGDDEVHNDARKQVNKDDIIYVIITAYCIDTIANGNVFEEIANNSRKNTTKGIFY